MPGDGRQITEARAGQARAKKVIKVGVKVANAGQGPLPLQDEPWDGNASGYPVTLANITQLTQPLKQPLKRDRSMRINERGCQSAKRIAHSLAHGFDTSAPLTCTNSLETRVREARALGATWRPLAYGPFNQQQQDASTREGYSAFEWLYELQDQKRVSPVRRIVVKREGKVTRAQTVRQRHRAWSAERRQPWQARVGNPRATKKRLNHGIQKVLQQDPEGQWSKGTLVGFGKHARELRVEVDAAKRHDATLVDGRYALVTTWSAKGYSTDQVLGLFKEHDDGERSHHIRTGHLWVDPVSLKTPIRIEGLLCMLWLALLVSLVIERR